MTAYPVLAVLFLALWAWAVFASMRARRWGEAVGWAVCAVIGAAIAGGRADYLPFGMKLILVLVFLAISLTLSWRQYRRGFHHH